MARRASTSSYDISSSNDCCCRPKRKQHIRCITQLGLSLTVLSALHTYLSWTRKPSFLHKQQQQQRYQQQQQQQQQLQRLSPPPQIAWLLSFPNSGTTYTMHLIQQSTRTTTATNYGQEQTVTVNSTSIPVHPSSIDGPFYRYLDHFDDQNHHHHAVPSDYILTKTHCGGFCDSCHSIYEYIETTDSFEILCRSGKRYVDGRPVPSTYAKHTAKRAVHLFRDPFDNIVARLHLRERRWSRQDADLNHAKRTQQFNSTRDGFRAYCRWMGTREKALVNVIQNYLSYKSSNSSVSNINITSLPPVSSSEASSDHPNFVDTIDQIPCFPDFVRYVFWHDHALEMIDQLPIHDVHTLYYEEYATSWNVTVTKLFDFLHLHPAVGAEPPQFIPGKHYIEYYTNEEVQLVKQFVQALSSTKLWVHLHRYFP